MDNQGVQGDNQDEGVRHDQPDPFADELLFEDTHEPRSRPLHFTEAIDRLPGDLWVHLTRGTVVVGSPGCT